MKYYCWRCQSESDMDPKVHLKLHEMMDNMRAYGTASCNLNDLGYDIDTNVKVKPVHQDFIEDKRKAFTFKEDEGKHG